MNMTGRLLGKGRGWGGARQQAGKEVGAMFCQELPFMSPVSSKPQTPPLINEPIIQTPQPSSVLPFI